jgi:hypothetical protein
VIKNYFPHDWAYKSFALHCNRQSDTARMCVPRNVPFGCMRMNEGKLSGQSVFRLGYLRNFFASRLSWDFDLEIRLVRRVESRAVCQKRSLSGSDCRRFESPEGHKSEWEEIKPASNALVRSLTANYTKWWLLRWSLSIIYPLAYKPFWRNIIFHYFNSILHSVMPSARHRDDGSVPFSSPALRTSDIRFSLVFVVVFFSVLFLFCQRKYRV